MTQNEAMFQYPEPGASLSATHEMRRIEVAHDPLMSFRLPVHQSWATAMPRGPFVVRPGQPEPLALFAHPKTSLGKVRVVVTAEVLQWEIDPLEWMRWQATKAGWRVAVAKVHPAPGGPRYELGALREVNGQVEVRRSMAMRSGARLLRCDAWSPMDAWASWHDALWWTLHGFALGQIVPGGIEAPVVHDGPLLRFGVPGSWDARGTGSVEGGAIWALQPAQDVQRFATLQVYVRRGREAPSAPNRRAALWYALGERGMEPRYISRVARPAFEAHVPGWLGQWQCSAEGAASVAVLAQREDRGLALDVLLTAPAAGTEHLDWMRATRAMDCLLANADLHGEARNLAA